MMELEKIPLDPGSKDLKSEIENKEIPSTPPEEENKAKEINVAGIIGIMFVLIAVIMLIVVIFKGGKKKKDVENKELDKAGSKVEFNFDRVQEKKQEVLENLEKKIEGQKDDKQESSQPTDEELLKNVNEKIHPAKTQSNYQPQNYSSPTYKSDRPDTRNSRSPRKGIDGLNVVTKTKNSTPAKQNQKTSPSITRDEFMAQQMGYAGMQGRQQSQQRDTREEFYGTQMNNAGEGNYLSYNSLWDGTIIAGALQTSIDTANPGVVIARVTENVYSSYDHALLLIPEGSLLYATYNTNVTYGQNRIQVAWTLLIRPDGYRLQLGNMNGVDNKGKSGYKGFVNNHVWETAKALGLVAAYSIIETEASLNIEDTDNEYMKNALTDVYAQGSKLGNKVVDKALDIKPSIIKAAGSEIKIITNRPLELPPVEQYEVSNKYVRTKY